MNKDAFIEEMLSEVKNLKDLAKEELPLIVKEYILASKVKTMFNFGWAVLMLGFALFCAVYAFTNGESRSGLVFCSIIFGGIAGLIGVICLGCCIESLIDLCCQPRRMAIKAITSLKDE